MTETQKGEPTSIVDGQWPRFVAGGPDDVDAPLEHMLEESSGDELMIQDMIADALTNYWPRHLASPRKRKSTPTINLIALKPEIRENQERSGHGVRSFLYA